MKRKDTTDKKELSKPKQDFSASLDNIHEIESIYDFPDSTEEDEAPEEESSNKP
jgi:hypothetical protein